MHSKARLAPRPEPLRSQTAAENLYYPGILWHSYINLSYNDSKYALVVDDDAASEPVLWVLILF